MSGEIVRVPSVASIDCVIEEICDAQSASDAVSYMDKLKKLLEIADEYKRYACEYCLKEASLYVKIAQMHDADSLLPRGKQNLVNWIRSKSEVQIANILGECSKGCRITSIRSREMKAKKEAAKSVTAISEFKRISERIVEEYKQSGKTVVSPARYAEEWQAFEAPDRATAKAYTEKTRDQIIHCGGVGIADGIGTYVNPKSANRDSISAAVSTRLNSIYKDLCSVAAICEDAKFSVPKEGTRLLRAVIERIEAI